MSPSTAPRKSSSATLDAACSDAMNLQLAGHLDRAEQCYRAILQAEPGHAAANYCLGMLYVQLHRAQEGVSYLLTALETEPTAPDYWLGYLEALLLGGRIEEARTTLAHGRQHGLKGSAVESFADRLAAKTVPSEAAPQEATIESSRDIPAISRAERRRVQRRDRRAAREQESDMLAALTRGDFAAALISARHLTERFPERGLGWKSLGALLGADESSEEAVAAMRTSVRLLPGDAEALTNLGVTLSKSEQLDEAETTLQNAIRLKPDVQPAYIHLGNLYQMQGRYQDAETVLRRAIALPADPAHEEDSHHTSLLFLMSHNPAIDADTLFAEHCRVGARLEGGLRESRPAHPNSRDPDRRIKVGFVSADLCNHAVASFAEPVLAQLAGRPSVELHAYYSNKVDDEISRRLQTHFKTWRNVCTLSNGQLAAEVVKDQIDILVDLSGHTSLNRLRAFAHKPAPVQLSWMGYPGTTGLRAMDYYLADRHFLPPGQFDRHFTEKLVYMPAGATFRPDPAAPPIQELAALHTGRMTFGSFNRIGKINGATIGLWSQLLRALPDAMMIIAGIPPETCYSKRLIDAFAAYGIAAARLKFHTRCNMDVYLALHHEVDICLDTIPYSGGTTTYHALWMGVPTLTVAGPTPASRQGAAIFGHLDLESFVAADASDFVAKGVHWANQLTALADVRAGLRQRALTSSVCDPHVIAAAFIRAARHMWIRWCNGLPAESFEIGAQQSDSRGAAYGYL
jgi:predicted O-linked N-acetylglucosamine transferase (SPINDLY family)